MKKILTVALAAGTLVSCTKDYDDVIISGDKSGIQRYEVSWQQAADSSSRSVAANFWNPQGKYFNKDNGGNTTFNYWPQAHALDVLVDAYLRTNDAVYRTQIDSWFDGVKQMNGGSFSNEFYDDMEWNALAMLRAYDATGDAKFKTAVDALWNEIKGGWNTTMGGGIMWRRAMPGYKNTPANMPAAILAARLYQKDKKNEDLAWAQKIYAWEKDSLFETGTGYVYDGINNQGDGKRDAWKFTYNQGTFIGAALELYNATGSAVYFNDAQKAAGYTLGDNTLTNSTDRLLRDEGEGDGGLFKGVFVRYFTLLIQHPDLSESYRSRYIAFLKHNAELLWFAGTSKSSVLFGTYWKNKPAASTDLTTQLSGAMLIEAAATLEKNKLF
ncbi:glycoside hydrolase family 76 protein [Flavihumibacter petaseus]|uniref:Putative glycosidase n=1 Tax=Flavihumibacter petaseus NBRC 106054 TaxID=1220578 RepID=A0A0E9N5M5_9BACT|nr:glycoside hydrolase family 76 protein [Flavihumibacter petaseus]GAO44645.1 putative glycosidase [Flavihumibacter petaseus NBRC 106054]